MCLLKTQSTVSKVQSKEYSLYLIKQSIDSIIISLRSGKWVPYLVRQVDVLRIYLTSYMFVSLFVPTFPLLPT